MIRAMIFDLDGTLVETERLKALSYARAIQDLCPYSVTTDEVLETFKDFVGLSRREMALGLLERFHMEEKASQRMADFGVSTPWQAFVQVRMRYYEEMVADPELLRSHQWPHNVNLLRLAKQRNCITALATMSYCDQTNHVLKVLDLTDQFDFIATREDVNEGKPSPEIYQLVSRQVNIPPDECLVIEDSTTGVRAALAAGMHVIAVSTPFTRDALHEQQLIPSEQIVDDPSTLLDVVRHFVHIL